MEVIVATSKGSELAKAMPCGREKSPRKNDFETLKWHLSQMSPNGYFSVVHELLYSLGKYDHQIITGTKRRTANIR